MESGQVIPNGSIHKTLTPKLLSTVNALNRQGKVPIICFSFYQHFLQLWIHKYWRIATGSFIITSAVVSLKYAN